MIVLSLFDGMSCGQIALKELGVNVSKYYASEIDKFAVQQTKHNFPNTIQLGDVTDWKSWDIDFSKVDLILAGSPCQGFSFAGKQLAFDDPRSKLFFVFVDILNHIKKLNKNVKFLLENVDMKRTHMEVITRYVGVFPVNINSNLVSAQNRNRWYWTNIATKEVGLFGEIHSDIPQPADKNLFLKDILEDEVDEKYYLSDKMIECLTGRKTKASNYQALEFSLFDIDSREKARTVNSRVYKMGDADNYIKIAKDGTIKRDQHKGSCLTAGGNSGGNHSDMDLICVAMRGRNPEDPTSRKVGLPTKQRLEANTSGKTNCLTSVQKDNLVLIGNIYNNGQNSQGGRVYDPNFKSATINGEAGGGGAKTGLYLTRNRIRRLTPTECAKLQTVPEWYKWIVSETQIYKMCGNGWTVSVIMWILSFMNKESNRMSYGKSNQLFV